MMRPPRRVPMAAVSASCPSIAPDPEPSHRRSRFDEVAGTVLYNEQHADYLLVKDDEAALFDYLATLVAKEYVVYNNPRAESDDLAEELVRMLIRVRRHLPEPHPSPLSDRWVLGTERSPRHPSVGGRAADDMRQRRATTSSERRRHGDEEGGAQAERLAEAADQPAGGGADADLRGAVGAEGRTVRAEVVDGDHVGDREERADRSGEHGGAGVGRPAGREQDPGDAGGADHEGGRLGAGDRSAPVAARARQHLGDDREDPADREQRRRLGGTEVPLGDGERGEERDRAVLAHRPDGADDRRQAGHRLGGKAHRHGRARRWAETHRPRRHERRGGEPGSAPEGDPPAARRPERAEHGGDRQAGRERHAVDAHGEPAPPAAGDGRHGLQPGREVQPGAGAEQHLGGDHDGKPVGEGGDHAARRRRRQAGEHQGTGAEATEHRTADEVGGGDRQRQQAERQAGLALGDAELGGDLRHHRRERLLADGDAEIGEAHEGERAPARARVAGEAASRGSAWRISDTVCNPCCTSTIAPSPSSSTRPLRSVPSTMPSRRGAAARRRRRNVCRASADGGMASAMAAVVPPYCGGKLYATNAGRFTFVNALFDVDGTLLATLDGDAVTRVAHRRGVVAGDPPPRRAGTPTVATVIGTGRQAWPHVEMLLRDAPRTRRAAHLRAPRADGRRTRATGARGRRTR